MSVKITQNAWNKINEILCKTKNPYAMIYSASSGGCNGFNFELDLLTNKYYEEISKNKYLTILKNDNSKVYIDPKSELYLLGTTIDYCNEDFTKKIYESKFIYKIDKNMMNTCGCGTSFSLK